MSLGIYPVFESRLTEAAFQALGEALASNIETLDRIAQSSKLTPLSSFGDNRPVPEDFEGDPNELGNILGPRNEWFDPAMGVAAVQALVRHIGTHPSVGLQQDEATQIIAELEELARVLKVAEIERVRFRLELG